MKNFLLTIGMVALAFGGLKVLDIGFAKEQRRQCIVAMDLCEKYSDACQEKYMEVCHGVEL